MKRAAVYCRVSSKAQAETGHSLPTQKKRAMEYCEKNNFSLVCDPLLEVHTAKENTLDRPKMNQLRDLIFNKEIDAIVIERSDRISRGDAYWYQTFRFWLRQNNVELHFYTTGKVLLGQAMPELMEDHKGYNNKEENEKRAEKAKQTRQDLSEIGFIMTAKPAYGYKIYKRTETLPSGRIKLLERKIVPDEQQAPVVREIYELYVYQDYSMYAICDYLTEKGYPSPADGGQFSKRHAHGVWNKTTVGDILKKEIYKGQFTYSSIPVDVPAIVSPELWQQAQEKRGKPKARRCKNSYLLTGRVFCKNCGSVMNGGTFRNGKSGTVQYYRCNTRYKPHKIGDCSVNRNFRVTAVDKTVIDWLIDVLTDDATLEQGLAAYQAEQEAMHKPLTEELAYNQEKLEKARKRLSRLLNAFLDDDEVEDIFMDKKRELQTEINQAESRIADIDQRLEAVLLTPTKIKTIKDFAAAARKGAGRLRDNPEAQKELLAVLEVEVYLSPLEGKQIEVKAVCALKKEEETRITANQLSIPFHYSKCYLTATFVV